MEREREMAENADLKMKPLERCPWLGKPVNKY